MVSSIGIGKEVFWSNLLKGVSGISEVTAFDTSGHATQVGGEVKNFKPDAFIDKRRLKFIGRASQMAIAATRLALDDARLDKEYIGNKNVSLCMGTTMGEIQSLEYADQSWVKSGGTQLERMAVYQAAAHKISSNMAIEFKLKGKNRIFTTACAAGNYAIGYGYDLLQLNEADCVIAGGADAFSWIAFTGFNKVSATAPLKCQPFDKNRKGMIPAEGAGVLVIEILENALKRNAPVYAEIAGYGLSCDAYHMTNPQVEGVSRCMRNALADAGIAAKDVDYISAHGTGTVFNDRNESAAIKAVFGSRRVAVSSIKSMLGHTMGAASAIEALTCCLAAQNDIIPPTINYEESDPECDIDCVPNAARRQKVSLALNNGFAFGGNNACVVIKKFKEEIMPGRNK